MPIDLHGVLLKTKFNLFGCLCNPPMHHHLQCSMRRRRPVKASLPTQSSACVPAQCSCRQASQMCSRRMRGWRRPVLGIPGGVVFPPAMYYMKCYLFSLLQRMRQLSLNCLISNVTCFEWMRFLVLTNPRCHLYVLPKPIPVFLTIELSKFKFKAHLVRLSVSTNPRRCHRG